MVKVFAVIALALALAGACYGAKRPAQLPELTQPIVVDGDLSDWKGAVSVPVWSETDICYVRRGYQWCDPPDISMEAYCGWRPEGLCFAAVVADDKVENLRTDDAIYWEDSVQLYLDGRTGEQFGQATYTAGAWQANISPPLPHRSVTVQAGGLEQQLRVAGRPTSDGYVIEALIPWSTFPDFRPKPGAVLGFSFAANDYDGDNPEEERPIQLSAGGVKDLYVHADRLTKWELVEALRTGEGAALGPLVDFASPLVAAPGMRPQLTAAVGTLLSPQIGSVRFTAADWRGTLLLDRTVRVAPAPVPWSGAVQAVLEWPSDVPLPSEAAVVGAVVNDREGKPLGEATRRLLPQGQ